MIGQTMRAIVHLVAARLRGRRAGTLMIPAAVAGAVAVLLGAGVISLLAQDATLRDAIEAAPPAERTVRVEVFKTANSQLSRDGGNPALTAQDEALVREALPAGRGPVGRAVVHSELPGGFGERRIVAVDDLRRRVRLRSGRLPQRCSADACEVLVLGGAELPRDVPLGLDGLELTATGRGDLDPQVAGQLPPAGLRSRFAGDSVYLVVPSFRALERIEALEFTPRRYSFSRELDPAAIHPWNVDALNRELRRSRGRLAASILQAEVHAPDALLGSERVRGVVAERRLLIIAGLAAAALLGFAMLAGTLRRRDVEAELARLSDAGARPWQLRALVALEAAALALAGVLGGVVLTALAALPTGVAQHALLAPKTLILAAAAFVTATLVLIGALAERRTGWAPAAVLALLVWQASERGALGPRDLAEGASAPPELLLMPGLIALVAALVTARLCGPLLKRLERIVRPAGVTVQLAVLSLVRRPGRTSAAAGFLAAGVTLGLFALSHADALRTGAREAAAFQAGADVRVTEAPAREGDPADVRPLDRYARLSGVQAAPAIRARGELLSAGRGVGRATLLGLPPAEARRLGFELQGAAGAPRLQGVEFPAGTRRLTVPVRARGVQAAFELVVEDASGRIVRLGTPFGTGIDVRAPRGGGRVIGIETTVVAGFAATAPVAEVQAGALRADGRVLSRFEDFRPTPGAQADRRPGSFRFETAASTGTLGLVAEQPGAGRPVPAIVSPRLAAEADRGGVLPLRLATGEVVQLQVAGTAPRLPTASGEFALFDVGRAYRAFNGLRAGTVTVNEMWLRTGDDAAVTAALRRPPFRDAEIVSRAQLTARVEADAVARSAIGALWVAAALALAIAACGLALTVRSALTDGAAELAELEAMGATPRELRRQLRLGAAVVGVGGAVVGAAGAAGLTALFSALVRISADGREPLPPLPGDVAWGAALAGLGGAALIAGLWVAAVTWRAFSADAAGRLGG